METNIESLIIERVLTIPIEEWKGYNTVLNGVTITLNLGKMHYNPCIVIDSHEFYDERIDDLEDKLRQRELHDKLIIKNNELIKIYESIK